MYMNRNEGEVTIGQAAEFEALVDELMTIQGENAGFVGATLLQSYANPGRYTLFSRWTDRDAAAAASRRAQFTAYAEKLRLSGVVRPTRLTESYEAVFEVDQPTVNAAASSAERWIDVTLTSATAAPNAEQRFRELAELGIKHAPGLLSVRLRRSLGDDTKYLLLVITTDRAAARAWPLVPEIRAAIEANAASNYLVGSPKAEIHHVVKRYAGPALNEVQVAAAAAVR